MALVCLCHGVSDRVIRAEIEDGASTREEIGRRCDAGLSCGTCHPTLDRLLATSAESDSAGCAA